MEANASVNNSVSNDSYYFLSPVRRLVRKNNRTRSAKRVSVATGLYAAIGATAGNAGMGAAIRAVAGTTAAFAQKGERVRVHGEALLEIRLQRPTSLPVCS